MTAQNPKNLSRSMNNWTGDFALNCSKTKAEGTLLQEDVLYAI